jgi:hypothetical protein
MNLRSRYVARLLFELLAASARYALLDITGHRSRGTTLRRDVSIGRPLPVGLEARRDRARGSGLLVAGVYGGRGYIDTVAIDRLVAVGVRLARCSFGGGTVLRTLAAAATRGTSTFVHAAIVE